MPEALKPSQEEIELELSEGYKHLQTWWKGVLDLLPDTKTLEQIGKTNSRLSPPRGDKPFSRFILFTIFHQDHAQSLCGQKAEEQLECSISIGFLEDPFSEKDNIYYFIIEPSQVQEKWRWYKDDPIPQSYQVIPTYYPFYGMNIHTARGVKTLTRCFIRHNSRSRSSKLVTSKIQLSPETQTVTEITQTAKDETLFPRPNPRYTVHKPLQEFTFVVQREEPKYTLNYQIGTLSGKRLEIASRAQERHSFLPYPEFNLLTAIERACKFEPVITPPSP